MKGPVGIPEAFEAFVRSHLAVCEGPVGIPKGPVGIPEGPVGIPEAFVRSPLRFVRALWAALWLFLERL